MCFLYDANKNSIVKDLTGPDFEPIRGLCERNDNVFTVARDKIIRQYLNLLFRLKCGLALTHAQELKPTQPTQPTQHFTQNIFE